ncbi:MAG: histidine kinase dimerization/phospho-acceptor domain-containing protein [Candidatus Acidiferrum sp.]
MRGREIQEKRTAGVLQQGTPCCWLGLLSAKGQLAAAGLLPGIVSGRASEAAIGFSLLSMAAVVVWLTMRMYRQRKGIPAGISGAALSDESGRSAGIAPTIEDAGERRQMNDSDRKSLKQTRSEEHELQLEGKSRHSQKMEVLGQLSGGIAHDFNNMLMVLSGSTELLEKTLPAHSPSTRYVEQIKRTIERATTTTKQLLAFSRKQVLDIAPIDLQC